MKKTILFALIWVAAVACSKKDEAAPQVELKATSVPYRQATTVTTADADLKVDLQEVNDSRCPINADCIQLGEAKMTFKISDGANQANVQVTLKGDKAAQEAFSLGGKNFVILVSELLPYPQIGQSPKLEDYKVSVSIEAK